MYLIKEFDKENRCWNIVYTSYDLEEVLRMQRMYEEEHKLIDVDYDEN